MTMRTSSLPFLQDNIDLQVWERDSSLRERLQPLKTDNRVKLALLVPSAGNEVNDLHSSSFS
jgi:hypothetical protein